MLFGALALFGFSFGLLQVFGNAGSVKGALERSGIYQSIVEKGLAQAQAEQGEAAIGSIPLDRPEVQNIIKTAASPELLQAKTENALDAVYVWMRGETPDLTFSLEIGDIKAGLADGIEQYAIQYASSLPKCAPGAAVDTADLFNAACLPEGADPGQLAAEAKNNFLGGEAFQETTFTADTIKIGDDETLAQKIQKAPNIYRNITWSVYGFGLLALLLAGAVVLLGASWRSGLKKASFVFVAVGALSVLVSLLADIGMNRVADMAKEPLQQSVVSVADELIGSLRNWWMGYGIALALIGAGTLAALRLTMPQPTESKPVNNKPSGDTPATGGAGPSPSEAPVQPAPKPRPPKPAKKLVQ